MKKNREILEILIFNERKFVMAKEICAEDKLKGNAVMDAGCKMIFSNKL